MALAVALTLGLGAAVDPHWARLPMRTAAQRARGLIGGEGCQVIRAIEVSADPAFMLMLMGTDVGGVYRSLDGGATWHVAMVGWSARGGAAFALDPRNASRALGYGGNSNAAGPTPSANGLYATRDGAASWAHVLPLADATGTLDGAALAFDPSSFSPELGGCARAFACSPSAGLLASADGGGTWRVVNASLRGCAVAVDARGALLVASAAVDATSGLYTSADGGATLARLRGEATYGLTIPSGRTVYISDAAGVFASDDGGASFRALGRAGLAAGVPIERISVSPADARVMTAYWKEGPYYNTTRVFSNDGGATWAPSVFDNSNAFMPYNKKSSVATHHPTNASIVWDSGGDWVTRSDDGAATFAWAADGYNAVMAGGHFSFSIDSQGIMMVAAQDYNGAVTTDFGETWRYLDASGQSWGGFGYGGFAATSQVLWTGNAPSWTGPRTLTVSFDSGVTWAPGATADGSTPIYGGLDASYGLPGSPSTGFASDWRTIDGARSWRRMAGCTSVLTHDADPAAAAPPTLYGVDAAAAAVVASTDGGETWAPLFSAPATPATDLGYDWSARAMYVVAGSGTASRLWKCAAASAWACAPVPLPRDQYNASRVRTVAVDAAVPSVVYAGHAADVYAATNAVVRSVDSGATWRVLLLDTPLQSGAGAPLQGPHEVSCVRVHPATRELWAAGGCFGIWRAPAPA